MCAKQHTKYPKYILELRGLPLDGTAENVQHQFATGRQMELWGRLLWQSSDAGVLFLQNRQKIIARSRKRHRPCVDRHRTLHPQNVVL